MVTLLERTKDRYPEFELETLDNLILDQLNPEYPGFAITPDYLAACLAVSNLQKGIIRKVIISTTFSYKSEKHIRTYIQNYQAHITSLVNVISGYFNIEKIQGDVEYLRTLELIRDDMDFLLKFLTTRYQNYFDFKANVTMTYKLQVSRSCHDILDNILTKASVENDKLLSIALKPVWNFLIDDPCTLVSYQTLKYYDILLKEILSLVGSAKPFSKLLKATLISLNFNSFWFLDYLTAEIKGELENNTSHCAMVEILSRNMKKYNQVHEYPDISLFPKQKPIKEQISTWIIEEIEHIERSQNSTFNNAQSLPNPQFTDFKLQTDLSVAQLGYFIRVLFESGVIKNKNHREVIRFFAHQFKTKQTDIISWESLRSRYYNVEEGTKESIRELVIKILNQINKKD
jgi:hypothetical protein